MPDDRRGAAAGRAANPVAPGEGAATIRRLLAQARTPGKRGFPDPPPASLGLEEWRSPVQPKPARPTARKPGSSSEASGLSLQTSRSGGEEALLSQRSTPSPKQDDKPTSSLLLENGKKVPLFCTVCQSVDLRCKACHKAEFSIDPDSVGPPSRASVCLECGAKNDRGASLCQICGHSGEGWSSDALHADIGRLHRQVARCEDDILYLQRQLLEKAAELQRYKMSRYEQSPPDPRMRSRGGSGRQDLSADSSGWIKDLMSIVQGVEDGSSGSGGGGVEDSPSVRSLPAAVLEADALEGGRGAGEERASGQVMRERQFVHF